jgi:hypothetical protein
MKLRTRSTELSHFKALVVFVFAIYGILIPLWFAFHGNKLLGNEDQWRTMAITSTRIARSELKETVNFGDKTSRGAMNNKRLEMKESGRSNIAKRRAKRPPILPKPLHSFGFWPVPAQPRRKAVYYPGRLLSMRWDHLCCQSINCLRKFPLFPLLPSKKKFIRRLRLSENGRLYGQRISGLVKPPESGSYSIYMKCLSTCEFWLSDNEYPVGSKLLKKIVRGIPMEHGVKTNDSKSLIFKVSLQSGRVYFMDVLLTVYRYAKRPFEVLWKPPSTNLFVPITKEYLTGFQKNPDSLTSVLRLYAHSPSVKLSPFLESIEEPGDDDDDYTITGEKNDLGTNFQFMDNHGRRILVNSSLGNQHVLRLPSSFKSSESRVPLKECSHAPIFLKNENLTKYAGVWKTHFSSVFPGDATGHMMCIGNRYPIDCQGNKLMPRETVSKVLTFYSQDMSNIKTK